MLTDEEAAAEALCCDAARALLADRRERIEREARLREVLQAAVDYHSRTAGPTSRVLALAAAVGVTPKGRPRTTTGTPPSE